MKRPTVLITGSGGLIGSECVRFFSKKGFDVVGLDNDSRSYFFGKESSTMWNIRLLRKSVDNYVHHLLDIRNEKKINDIFKRYNINLVVHAAAQPSHDWAAKEPLIDFTINALGTLILLEATRNFRPQAAFAFISTNKVYGDTPNTLPLVERKTRYEVPTPHRYHNGIDESMSTDNSLHSIFGVSKLSADQMVLEYGKYFGLQTASFRGGCLTGPAHSPAQLHGFLAYLVRSIAVGSTYTIFGYKGKQVRDNIHSYDVANAIYHFYLKPRKGEAYNIGGSRYSNVSILEAVAKIEDRLKKKAKIKYSSKNRVGDHIWYISDITKFKRHYPKWDYSYSSDQIIKQLCEGQSSF